MLKDDYLRREFRLLDEASALAVAFLADRGLRLGIEFQLDDAVAIAVEIIGAAE